MNTNAQDIYNRLAHKVYRYAMSRLNNSADAEDVTSETFRRMLEQDRQDVRNWEAWLIGMARNVINEKYRERQKANLHLSLDESDAAVSLDKQPEFLLSLNTGLENLEPETREIIILKTWEELKFEEIAEVMGLNINNVKAKYYRGIDDLKMKLNTEDKDKKVRSVALQVILLGIAQMAKSSVLAPSPEFLGKLWEKIGAEFTNLNINYQDMSKNTLKQLLSRKLFVAAAIMTVVIVGGITGVTLLLANNNQLPVVQPENRQPNNDLPTEPVLIPEADCANGYYLYNNDEIGASICLPNNWHDVVSVKRNSDPANNTITICFTAYDEPYCILQLVANTEVGRQETAKRSGLLPANIPYDVKNNVFYIYLDAESKSGQCVQLSAASCSLAKQIDSFRSTLKAFDIVTASEEVTYTNSMYNFTISHSVDFTTRLCAPSNCTEPAPVDAGNPEIIRKINDIAANYYGVIGFEPISISRTSIQDWAKSNDINAGQTFLRGKDYIFTTVGGIDAVKEAEERNELGDGVIQLITRYYVRITNGSTQKGTILQISLVDDQSHTFAANLSEMLASISFM